MLAMTQHKIIHIDADCFYAAVEMRDQPALRSLPIAVGGGSSRGVVATCNYAARKFGVRSAMSSVVAKRLCPELVFIKPRMAVYKTVSKQIREIFEQYTDLIEPLSLDEAYLDVSACQQLQGSATLIAEAIRANVHAEIGITVSAGVAPNKFLAKIASDWHKPDGLTVIRPEQVDAFVLALPVGKLHGVGKVTEKRLSDLGWLTCADLRQQSQQRLQDEFGRFGHRLYHLCRGIDERSVSSHRQRKSLSVENTFHQDLPDLTACLAQIADLFDDLQRRLSQQSDVPNKAFVKLKFHDFSQTTFERAIEIDLQGQYHRLLSQAFARKSKPVRLIGLGVRFGEAPPMQQRLFP